MGKPRKEDLGPAYTSISGEIAAAQSAAEAYADPLYAEQFIRTETHACLMEANEITFPAVLDAYDFAGKGKRISIDVVITDEGNTGMVYIEGSDTYALVKSDGAGGVTPLEADDVVPNKPYKFTFIPGTVGAYTDFFLLATSSGGGKLITRITHYDVLITANNSSSGNIALHDTIDWAHASIMNFSHSADNAGGGNAAAARAYIVDTNNVRVDRWASSTEALKVAFDIVEFDDSVDVQHHSIGFTNTANKAITAVSDLASAVIVPRGFISSTSTNYDRSIYMKFTSTSNVFLDGNPSSYDFTAEFDVIDYNL